MTVPDNPRQLSAEIFRVVTGTSEPIYRQLIEQLRRLLAGGQVLAGDAMPSVREVASELGVNPMTVSKAYSMLEAEGLLVRRRGLGMEVAAQSDGNSDLESRLELLRPGLERIAVEASQLELEPKAVIALLTSILKGK
ncbi:GntR family transcriptional regulator [Undibacterium sp. CY18W]|uniref:GntR family transcriptional regulator n=1 Tax=Undibacterium hunanense TaxID=2762292 RepID=A0ABR6ZPP1_9BURK|nr:GntR family transcriptional regulator [Undibacterium hunanense]MBC3917872.1 GntR family transcriptional regulator [Undibacterium hunanense]